MATKKEILDYVMQSPYNTNPAILEQLLDGIEGGGGGGNTWEYTCTSDETGMYFAPDGSETYEIGDIFKLEFGGVIFEGIYTYSPPNEAEFLTDSEHTFRMMRDDDIVYLFPENYGTVSFLSVTLVYTQESGTVYIPMLNLDGDFTMYSLSVDSEQTEQNEIYIMPVLNSDHVSFPVCFTVDDLNLIELGELDGEGAHYDGESIAAEFGPSEDQCPSITLTFRQSK